MSEECFFFNPLRRDGASRRRRLCEALRPSFVAVDERRFEDLLLYVRKYAKLLRYYTPDNSIGGDWVEFFESDASSLVAVIAGAGAEAGDLKDAFQLERSAAEAGDGAAFAALFQYIVEYARRLDRWYRAAVPGLSLHRALERLIGSDLAAALREAAACAARARALRIAQVPAVDPGEFSAVWGLAQADADPSLFPFGLASKAHFRDAAGKMAKIFDRFSEATRLLVASAPSHLGETLTDYPEHRPHMALLLAFLQLFEHARDQLNSLTAEHLDFYFREVLGLEHRVAEPDRAHLVCELAKNVSSHRLAPDTYLKAGKDATGVELLYATDSELVIHRAQLDPTHGLKTIFVDKTPGGVVTNVYAAPDADSADGRGAKIEDEEGKWETFGSTEMPYAEIGFAVASPMFLLGEGTRIITLKFLIEEGTVFPDGKTLAEVADELVDELAANVKVYASGEKEWLRLTTEKVELLAGPVLIYRLILGADAGPVVAYDPEVLDGGFGTDHPVVKFVLDNEGVSYPYKYFQAMAVTSLEISVEVDGMRSLILENDLGILNPAKPFHPFGPVPRSGSSFLVGNHEVFQKGVTELRLAIRWADLPIESFTDYYAQYTAADDNPIIVSNAHFTAAVSILEGGVWRELGTGDLFVTPTGAVVPAAENDAAISLSLLRDAELGTFERFAPALRQGFLKATLDQSFLHGMYPRLLAAAARSQTPDIPNPPYTPLMASLTLGYTATETIDYTQQGRDDFDDRVENVFQIGPFGHREIYPIAGAPAAGVPIDRKLVPEFTVTVREKRGSRSETAEGTLLIGIDGLEPPQNLALLLQVAEGSEDPAATAQEVVWSYLSQEEWVDFGTRQILADATRGLLTSGIVKFAVPEAMSASRTVLPAGLHWIKASVARDTRAVPRLIAVHPQAVVASFRDQGNDPAHLAQALAAESISKLRTRTAAVKSVRQPYASFGGRRRESDESFYTRVSERLRHKGRAVTLWDYERLVLEKFPEVYNVRCLNHTGGGCEHAPGRVTLVVVPNLRNKNAVDPLKPRFSLNKLASIRGCLAELASDFITLEVVNPDYEEIRVRFNVRFRPGRDKGHFTRQLDREIVGFLSPWLHDDALDLTLGGRIHRSSILNFVEEREYVDFVTDFEMDHHHAGARINRNVEEAVATHSGAALVSAQHHEIGHDVVSCEDPEA